MITHSSGLYLKTNKKRLSVNDSLFLLVQNIEDGAADNQG